MYYSDEPISLCQDDRLNRKQFAQRLAESILKLKINGAFTIGLYGKWGCGKTSIVNILEQEIESLQESTDESERLIVVHFEPWNFSNCDQLLSQFFIMFASELKKLSKRFGKKDRILNQVGEALETYSEMFSLVEAIPVFGKALSLILHKGTSVIGGNLKNKGNDISSQKQSIIKILNCAEQKHNFLIIIDDVDRLNNDQIRLIFQLITSIANFPKMRYLVVFDKDVVVKALEKVQEGSGEAYLEKIIQMPIEVPDASKAQINRIMQNNLKEIFEEYYHSPFDFALWRDSYSFCCEPFIKSIRDINRICNTLSVKLVGIAPEVDFMDMTAITTLQILFPPIYEWIKTDSSNFLDYKMFPLEKDKSKETALCKEKIMGILRGLAYSSDETNNLVEALINCLGYLFPNYDIEVMRNMALYTKSNSIKNNRIFSPNKFDRYFNLDVSAVPIKKAEIIQIMGEYTLNQIVEGFSKHNNNGTIFELFDEINAHLPDIKGERAKIMELAVLDSFFKTCFLNESVDLSTYDGYTFLSYQIIGKVLETERIEFLNKIVGGDDFNRVIAFMPAMRYIEMDHGRLESGYKRDSVVSEIDLGQIEKTLCKRVNKQLNNHSLYDEPHWMMMVNLLEGIHPNFFDDYFNQSFKESVNILKFLRYSVNVWNNGACYQVIKNYEKYLTKEQILNAIKEMRDNGGFYNLPREVQKTSAAFYYDSQERRNGGEIERKDINALLNSWEDEDGIKKLNVD